MSAVASKNPYDLLGDDGGEAQQTAKPAVKTEPLNNRRTEPTRGSDRGGRGGGARRGGDDSRRGGNDSPRGGRNQNDSFRSERFTERGGKGGGRDRGRPSRPRDDRHSKTGVTDTEKQVAQGWGGNTGNAEWGDEQAGESIAKSDEKSAAREDAQDGAAAGEEAEPEDKVTSYADYLAQQASSKLSLSASAERKANEGNKADKSWAQNELKRDEDEQDFFVGEQKRQKAPKTQKERNVVELDQRYIEPPRLGGERGGRGGRGGRGSHDREGGRGRGGEGRGGAPRGEYRGGRGGNASRGGQGGGGARGGSSTVNVSDEKAFPTLGS